MLSSATYFKTFFKLFIQTDVLVFFFISKRERLDVDVGDVLMIPTIFSEKRGVIYHDNIILLYRPPLLCNNQNFWVWVHGARKSFLHNKIKKKIPFPLWPCWCCRLYRGRWRGCATSGLSAGVFGRLEGDVLNVRPVSFSQNTSGWECVVWAAGCASGAEGCASVTHKHTLLLRVSYVNAY